MRSFPQRLYCPGTLARQAALWVCVLSLLVAALVWALGRLWLIPAIETGERAAASAEALRMRDSYLEAASGMVRAQRDWTRWQQLADAANGVGLEHLLPYVSPARLADLGVDWVALFKPDASTVFTAELSGRQVIFDSQRLAGALRPDSEFGRHLYRLAASGDPYVISGIVRFPTGRYYSALAPVQGLHASGEPAGFLLWATRADRIVLRSQSTFLRNNTRVLSLTSRQLPDEVVAWRHAGRTTDAPLTLMRSFRVDSWIGVSDLDGRPALFLGQSLRRDQSQLAAAQVNRLALIAVVAILLVGLAAVWVVQSRLGARLAALGGALRRLERPGQVEPLAIRADDELGEVVRAVNTLIGRKNAAEAGRVISEQRFEHLFEHLAHGLLLVEGGRVVQANPAAGEQFGDCLPGTALAGLFCDDDARAMAICARCAEPAGQQVSWRGQCRLLGRSGAFEAELTVTRLPGADGGGLLLQVDDISEREANWHAVRQLAFHDALTGLVNRTLFLDRLEHRLAQDARAGGTFVLMYMDLDGFKAVNDHLGHAAGDRVLQVAAQRMAACLRDGDTLARLSGDEFALLLEGEQGHGSVVQIANRLLAELEAPIVLDGGPVRVSASIGVLLAQAAGMSAATALERADAAMYRAKHAGKAGIAFWDGAPLTV